MAAIGTQYHFMAAEMDALTASDLRFWSNALGALNERVKEAS